MNNVDINDILKAVNGMNNVDNKDVLSNLQHRSPVCVQRINADKMKTNSPISNTDTSSTRIINMPIDPTHSVSSTETHQSNNTLDMTAMNDMLNDIIAKTKANQKIVSNDTPANLTTKTTAMPIELTMNDNSHLTCLFGYNIPTTTLYFILVLICIAVAFYFVTNKQKKKKDDENDENDKNDKNDKND